MFEAEAVQAVTTTVVAVGVPVVARDDRSEATGQPAGAHDGGAHDGGANGPRFELLGDLGAIGGNEQARAVRSLLPEDADDAWLVAQGFRAKRGQSLVLRSAAGAPSVVLLGLGRREDLDAEAWRLSSAALVRAAGPGTGAAALLLPHEPLGMVPRDVGRAVAEGAALAGYHFDEYRSKREPSGVDRIVVVAPSETDEVAEGLRRGLVAARAVWFARDLVNAPPSDLPPRALADRVADHLGAMAGTTVEVWDESRIAKERLGGLMAVARGSAEPPRLVRATYTPDGSAGADVGHVVLVGKGITFDSGGLSLKSPEGMTTMKTDMTGAAVVCAVIGACAELRLPVKVSVIAPVTENMPGERAQKPGDVFTARNGMTVEVLNTDAEGRLVLADGLSLAVEAEPDAIVDVATLTGAQVVALGRGMGAVVGTNEGLVDALRRAGDRSGERLWPMPLPDDYESHIDSEIADMKNTGRPGEAGVTAGAMLLKRFAGDVPWAHLDIAGPARAQEASGYLAKGGTAFGVRALLDFLEHFSAMPA